MKKQEKHLKEVPRSVSLVSKKNAKNRNKKWAGKYFAPYRLSKILDEVDLSDIDFDEKVFKDSLHPKIWSQKGLDPRVSKSLKSLAQKFYEFLDIDALIIDIIITGSIANYNWHDKSDVDLHVVINYDQIDEDEELVREFLMAKKTIWNNKYSITMFGHDVELYAQDSEEEHTSSGVYSLKDDAWKIIPKKKDLTVDVGRAKAKAATLMNMIDSLDTIKDHKLLFKRIEKIKDKIKGMRKIGLSTPAAEFSPENLAFKILRNTDYLQKINDIKTSAFNKVFSVNEEAKSKAQQRFFGMVRAAQKGELENPSPSVKKAAGSMGKTDVMDFASTDHKGLPNKVKTEEKKEGKKVNKLEVQKNIDGMTNEKLSIIKDFISFAKQKLGIEEPVFVGLRNSRDEYITTTASYIPSENKNFIRCGNRALVDILRSIAHEFTHNRQRELGIFQIGEDVQDIGGKVENQANSIAGIMIKDFAKNHGYERIYDIV